jgi:hypothetical protein
MPVPHYTPEPHILGWLRAFTLPSDKVLDVGSGDRRYQDIGAATVKGLDIWPAAQPDFLLNLEKDDLPAGDFSLVLLLDLLEHLSEKRGRKILAQAQALTIRAVVVLTPLKWEENRTAFEEPGGFYQGNETILHRSLWSLADFGCQWTRVWLPSTLDCFSGYWVRR